MVGKYGWSPKRAGVQPFSSVCLVERAQMQVGLALGQQNEKIANVFANELFTTTKTKSYLAVQIEVKSPIKEYQGLHSSTLRDKPLVSFRNSL